MGKTTRKHMRFPSANVETMRTPHKAPTNPRVGRSVYRWLTPIAWVRPWGQSVGIELGRALIQEAAPPNPLRKIPGAIRADVWHRNGRHVRSWHTDADAAAAWALDALRATWGA